LRSCGEFEDLACVWQQHPSGRGQFNVSSISYEQRRAHALLERLDLLRERRRGDVQAFGRSREVQLLGNRDEVPKQSQLHGLNNTPVLGDAYEREPTSRGAAPPAVRTLWGHT
jgi:hypothetical protein